MIRPLIKLIYKSKMLKNPLVQALLVGTVCSLFLIFSTYYIDNTTYITANGLYKATGLLNYMNSQRNFDPTHVIYDSFMVNFLQIFGLNLLPGTLLTKIALVNSIMSGISIAALWLILWELTRQIKIVIPVVILYLFSAYFLFLSISSEDILPSFAMFIVSIYFIVRFFNRENTKDLIISGTFFALSFLLHLTLIMAYPAYLLSIFYKVYSSSFGKSNRKISRKTLILYGKKLFPVTSIFMLTTFLITLIFVKSPNDALWVLWPPLLEQSGWSGFYPSKIAFTFLSGIGQSILLGRNLSSIGQIFALPNILTETATLVLAAFIILALIRVLKTQKNIAPLIIFLLINFIIVEAVNLKTQGQDPQFQIPALIILPIGLGIIYNSTKLKMRTIVKNSIFILIALAVYINGKAAISTRGADSSNVRYAKEVAALADPKKSIFLTHGFDQIQSWGPVIWNVKAPETFIGFTTYLVSSPNLTADETSQKLLNFLEESRRNNKQIIATDVLILSDGELLSSLSTVDNTGKGLAMRRAILRNYTSEFVGKTSHGPLYRLTAK